MSAAPRGGWTYECRFQAEGCPGPGVSLLCLLLLLPLPLCELEMEFMLTPLLFPHIPLPPDTDMTFLRALALAFCLAACSPFLGVSPLLASLPFVS